MARMRLSAALVGTYPPTQCGIATFTASLGRAIATAGAGADVGIIRCLPAPSATPEPEVLASLIATNPASLDQALDAAESQDVVILQHEFGIFGGPDGRDVLDFVEALEVPLITTLHTVRATPTPGQREVLDALLAASDRVVVQSRSARTVLLAQHDIDPGRVQLIPHGANPNVGPPVAADDRPPNRPARLLTWGLIGRGKGIEYALEAIATLRDLDPLPHYLVLGATHPNAVEHEGQAYRNSLIELAHDLGIADVVEFDDNYHTTAQIRRRIREADVVVLPYRSREQVVSGVLVEAIASYKPVVATAFPHAAELLADGAGIVVQHDDGVALGAAIRSLVTDPGLAERAAQACRRQAATLSWEQVGMAYQRLAQLAIKDRSGAGRPR